MYSGDAAIRSCQRFPITARFASDILTIGSAEDEINYIGRGVKVKTVGENINQINMRKNICFFCHYRVFPE